MIIFNYAIDFQIIFVLTFCVVSQSIFGVGVLLWGTPLLILTGLNYIEVLSLLLPISLSISLMQFLPNVHILDKILIKNTFFYCAPCVATGLFLTLYTQVNVRNFVIIFLILGGLLRLKVINKLINDFSINPKFALGLIGIIHGISNLGGSVLVVWAGFTSNSINYYRALVSGVYSLLALSQLIILLLYTGQLHVSVTYTMFAIALYMITARIAHKKFNYEFFQLLLTLLIFMMVVALLLQ